MKCEKVITPSYLHVINTINTVFQTSKGHLSYYFKSTAEKRQNEKSKK